MQKELVGIEMKHGIPKGRDQTFCLPEGVISAPQLCYSVFFISAVPRPRELAGKRGCTWLVVADSRGWEGTYFCRALTREFGWAWAISSLSMIFASGSDIVVRFGFCFYKDPHYHSRQPLRERHKPCVKSACVRIKTLPHINCEILSVIYHFDPLFMHL